MKIDLVRTDPPYSVRREPGRQASKYDLIRERDIAEMVDMCSDYVKLGDNEQIFSSLVQLSLWVKAVSASSNCVIFQHSKRNEKVGERMFLGRREATTDFTWETSVISTGTHAKKCSSYHHRRAHSELLKYRYGFGLFFFEFELPLSIATQLGVPFEQQCVTKNPESAVCRICNGHGPSGWWACETATYSPWAKTISVDDEHD